MTTNFNETFAGNKIMTAYNLQKQQNSKFEHQIKNQFDLTISLTKRVGWMSPIMYFICSIGIALVMFCGNHLIISGKMTAGSFASFVTSLLLLYKPVKDLGRTLTDLQSTFVALGRVFELFDLIPHIKNKENAIKLKPLTTAIDFENVNFEYEQNVPVLKNLTLHVNKGETLALVGNSGGGKSTIVNLLPRFYDIQSGSIKFDGIDIKELDIESLRENISFVFQDNFLFSGTIRENILMGKKDATNSEIETVIKMAHLDEFLSTLDKGIDTYVGERGASLSGGQRQRVAIARAMIKDAPIVILDEATSALDNESEAIVQKALDNLIKNKTVFVIAHRLSTIRNANRIAVINEGELVELGTHEELMNIPDGNYKHLYEMQFKLQEQIA
jgi:subfamily B ATP-binding cassette protein MsbA